MLGEARQKELIGPKKLNFAPQNMGWGGGKHAIEPIWIRTCPHPGSIIERAMVASHPNENNLTVRSWQVQLAPTAQSELFFPLQQDISGGRMEQ